MQLFVEHITCVINVNKRKIDIVVYRVVAQTTGKIKHIYQVLNMTYIWMGGGWGCLSLIPKPLIQERPYND